MKTRFEKYIESASANKRNFDRELDAVKESLQASVKQGAPVYTAQPAKTGWLKGSLSYPWVLICSIAPAIKEIF